MAKPIFDARHREKIETLAKEYVKARKQWLECDAKDADSFHVILIGAAKDLSRELAVAMDLL